MTGKKVPLRFIEKPTKTEQILIRCYPETKDHLQRVSDLTGYTITSLVEWAIHRLSADDFPNCPVCGMNRELCTCVKE